MVSARAPLQPRRAGFALVVVLLGVLVLSGLTLTALKMGADEASAARATRSSTSALFVADAGVRATQIDWPVAASSLGAGDSLVDAGWTSIGNGSSYHRTIHRRDGGSGTLVYTLTVEGRTFGPLGGESTVQVWLTSAPARFMGAVASRTSLTLSSTSYTDSFDSRLGVYGGTNIKATGDVFANGNVTLSGSAHIAGDVTAGGSFTNNSSNGVNGTVTTRTAVITFPQEACPAGGFSALPAQAGVTYSQSTGKLATGDSVVFNTSGTYYFDEVSLSDGARMIVPPGVSVTLYIGNEFTVSGGGGVTNRGRDAANVTLISCGPNTLAWTLSGGGDAYFTIYAPNNKITLSGGNPVYGAIVAGEFDSSGGAPVHFDRALMAAATRPNLISRSWSQVLP